MWTPGPFLPETAAKVQQDLSQKAIVASVKARGYGETDSCGVYNQQGIDFTISLENARFKTSPLQQEIVDNIYSVLEKHGKPSLGNVKLVSSLGEVIPLNSHQAPSSFEQSEVVPEAESTPTKQVYVIVYDPLLSSGQTLSEYVGWNDHTTLTQQTIDFFAQASSNKLSYSVVDTTIVTSGWPDLIDGFSYTESEYLAVLSGQQSPHYPTEVDYNKIVNSPQFDICGKLDHGEIDEVWIYNGPWFGFYESTLVGPGAFYFNSSPVSGSHGCNRLLPIMGPTVERTVHEAVHNFTHRTESTMTKVYGSWEQNNTSHNWNKFALVRAQSPDYSYSGCGSSHYPPNGTTDYEYDNLSTELSNCDDFANYPNLSDPLQVAQPVGCATWGCNGLSYYDYWYSHFPSNTGCGSDNVANDWWAYHINPAFALYPSMACQTDIRIVSGNVGIGNANLTYIDGTQKSITADSYGNYFLLVSNQWSGVITPTKAGYTFSPTSREYTDVESDFYNQDYTAEGTGTVDYYVNVAIGDNNNSCTTIAAPCRNIQEAINKASDGDIIYVTSGTYLFSTNGSPNVVIINQNITLSGGWNSDFTAQHGASTIDGENVNNGILVISGNVTVENFIIQNSISWNSGAIYIINGNITLRGSTLRNNVATNNGAGIFLDNGSLSIVNSTISGNTANSSGGAYMHRSTVVPL